MIYVSTGGFRNKNAFDSTQFLKSANINSIELSGGLYCENQLESLKSIKSTTRFMVHNYFPPTKEPFVFNLASLNQDVATKSFNHAVMAMQWAVELDNPNYSFHAGFLLDPDVKELGKKVKNRELFNREVALDFFVEQLNKLSTIANKLGVSLMIENNVLSPGNYNEFSDNPFLMATSDECKYIMERTPKNINLLIDVAHLKVSANTLGFNKKEFLEDCSPWIKGYHLSDNNGMRDSNECVNKDSWFWPFLKKDLNFYTLEVYVDDLSVLVQQLQLAKLKIFSDTNL